MATDTDVRGRRSAKPDGAGNVVTSMMRNLRRVMLPPLTFFHVVRKLSVPNTELLGGSDVKSRTRFGAASHALHPLAFCTTSCDEPSTMIGPLRFSGPGIPRRWPNPALVPLLSLK